MIGRRGLLIAACVLLAGLATTTAEGPSRPRGLYVGVGYGGRRISSADGVHWEHDQQWSDVAADDDNVLFNVAFGKGKFVAVGGASVGHILTTRDGITWDEVARPKGRVATVAFGVDRFVAGHGDRFEVSTDGERWAPGGKLDARGGFQFRKGAFGKGVFVVIGDFDPEGMPRTGFRASTPDGVEIASLATHTPAARAIAFGAGRFVVVGPDGLRESSADGKTWEDRADAPGEDFNSVVWTGRRFLVAGGTAAYSSADGITWTREEKGIPCSVLLARDGLIVGGSWGGTVWNSKDGRDWAKGDASLGNAIEAVAFGVPE